MNFNKIRHNYLKRMIIKGYTLLFFSGSPSVLVNAAPADNPVHWYHNAYHRETETFCADANEYIQNQVPYQCKQEGARPGGSCDAEGYETSEPSNYLANGEFSNERPAGWPYCHTGSWELSHGDHWMPGFRISVLPTSTDPNAYKFFLISYSITGFFVMFGLHKTCQILITEQEYPFGSVAFFISRRRLERAQFGSFHQMNLIARFSVLYVIGGTLYAYFTGLFANHDIGFLYTVCFLLYTAASSAHQALVNELDFADHVTKEHLNQLKHVAIQMSFMDIFSLSSYAVNESISHYLLTIHYFHNSNQTAWSERDADVDSISDLHAKLGKSVFASPEDRDRFDAIMKKLFIK